MSGNAGGLNRSTCRDLLLARMWIIAPSQLGLLSRRGPFIRPGFGVLTSLRRLEKSTKVLTRLWQTCRNAIQTQTRVVADALSQRVTGTAPHEPLPAKGLGQRFLAHRAALLLRICPVKVWAICLWTKRSVAERRDGFRSSSWYASHQSNVRVSMEKRGHTPITLVRAALAYFLDTPGNLAAR